MGDKAVMLGLEGNKRHCKVRSSEPVHFKILALLLSILVLSCDNPKTPLEFENVTETERKKFGLVGVSSVGFKPEATLRVPCRGTDDCVGKGIGAGIVAPLTAGGATGGGSGPGSGLEIVLLPAFMIVGGVVGGIYGAASALPESTANEIERVLVKSVKASKPRESLRSLVLKDSRNAGIENVVDLGDLGVEEVPEQSLALEIRAAPVDSVLQVGVAEVLFWGESGSDPELALVVRSQFRIGPKDGSVAYYKTDSVRWVSETKLFRDWRRNEGRPVREALEKAYRYTAERIVESVFLVYVSPAAEE